MKYRKIEKIFTVDKHHWVGNGFRVKQYFPGNGRDEMLERFSPFILMDYNEPYTFAPSEESIGVDAHPHRGFETVTFSFEGKIEHRDNKGNQGVIDKGDIQWMTAGSGILHKEYHESQYSKEERDFHMIQLWVNLPQKDKMIEPKYQAITSREMGNFKSKDGKAKGIVYAGEVFGVDGPASTHSPMNIYKVDMEVGARLSLKEPKSYNTGFLVLKGDVKINENQFARRGEFVLFENDGEEFIIESVNGEAEIFVLSGEPLNEPIVAIGPFVMNTYEEILQANEDFRRGDFGSWEF